MQIIIDIPESIIEEAKKDFANGWYDEDSPVDIVFNAIARSEALPTWIRDKQPEKNGHYIVTGHRANEPYETWVCEYLYLFNGMGGWCNSNSRPRVEAWMPMPKDWRNVR